MNSIDSSFDKKVALPTIGGVSLIAILFLVWLIYFQEGLATDAPWVAQLPYLNATFNSISAICLLNGLVAIKKGQRLKHQRWMLSAFVASACFLVSYIVYHSFHGDTKFLAEGLVRPMYFTMLISHIVLSVVALPLIFTTFYFSLTGRFQLHKKIARITFPIWLYVSVTGVLIVAFLKLFNPA